MSRHFTVVGFGDQARVVWDIVLARKDGGAVRSFVNLVPNAAMEPCWQGVEVFNSFEEFKGASPLEGCDFVVALGDPGWRRSTFRMCVELGMRPVTIIHPTAVVSKNVLIAPGSVISAFAFVGVGSSIGVNCIINTGAIVEHGAQIAAHVNINPRAALAGNVSVEELVTVGMGAIVLEGLKLGEGSFVAAGAVVRDCVAPHTLVAGVPATIKKALTKYD